jgi:hypothetical protein
MLLLPLFLLLLLPLPPQPRTNIPQPRSQPINLRIAAQARDIRLLASMQALHVLHNVGEDRLIFREVRVIRRRRGGRRGGEELLEGGGEFCFGFDSSVRWLAIPARFRCLKAWWCCGKARGRSAWGEAVERGINAKGDDETERVSK